MVGESASGAAPRVGQSRRFRMPSCGQLWMPRVGFFKTFDQYQNLDQYLNPNLMPMTRVLYDAFIESCRIKPMPAPEAPAYEDLPERTLPEGQEYA
jgi:hypothetical protein